jgi:Tfp pilus assembly protein PilO
MTSSGKQNLSLMGLGVVIIAFIAFIVYPLFSGIQKEADNFISQKKKLVELERKIQNLENFQKSYEEYLPNLGKIAELLINPSEPINFIEFLEKEARNADLDIEILPFAPEEEEDFWSSMNFRLSLTGTFSNFLKFLEKLESAPYLVEILNLNATERDEEEPGVGVSLLIKVYTK